MRRAGHSAVYAESFYSGSGCNNKSALMAQFQNGLGLGWISVGRINSQQRYKRPAFRPATILWKTISTATGNSLKTIICYSSRRSINWTCAQVKVESEWREISVKMEHSSGTDGSVMRRWSADSPGGNVLHLSAAPQERNLIKDDGWKERGEAQEPWELMDIRAGPTFPYLSTGLRESPFC